MNGTAMHPSLAAWEALRASGARRGALVTLVRADGGASRTLGTRLAVADDGRTFGSVTVGGCADGRALAAAQRAIASGRREALTLPLSEDDALALGLGCAGDVDLLVEPVSLGEGDPLCRALDDAIDACRSGAPVALATPIQGPLGGPLVVRADGTARGGTGDPTLDAAGTALAIGALRSGRTTAGLLPLGDAQWFVEVLAPARTLLIVGATEIAATLCVLAAPLGWRTIVLDPRDEVLAQTRFAMATERVPSLPAEVVARLMGDGEMPAVVVVAHDYRVELPVLRVALAGSAAYVGMLGSRARGARMRELLAEAGLDTARIARLRTPIGLAIGAQGAAEIAVSIVAELIATWRGVPQDRP